MYKVNTDVYEDVKLKALQRSYKSHPNYVQSDHKPVTGEFDITVMIFIFFFLCTFSLKQCDFSFNKLAFLSQTRPDYEEHGVEFQPVSAWFIDEENSVSYKLLGDARSTSGDWIGLFHEGFSSLDDYLVYEYVGRGKHTEYSIFYLILN